MAAPPLTLAASIGTGVGWLLAVCCRLLPLCTLLHSQHTPSLASTVQSSTPLHSTSAHAGHKPSFVFSCFLSQLAAHVHARISHAPAFPCPVISALSALRPLHTPPHETCVCSCAETAVLACQTGRPNNSDRASSHHAGSWARLPTPSPGQTNETLFLAPPPRVRWRLWRVWAGCWRAELHVWDPGPAHFPKFRPGLRSLRESSSQVSVSQVAGARGDLD